MDDGFEIPMGADLAPLNDAINRAVAVIEQMGQQLTAAFERANASVAASVAQITAFQAGSSKAATASAQAGSAAAGTAQKFAGLANMAVNVGTAVSGAATALSVMSRASRALSGVSLAGHLSALVARAGGLRAAFSRIPGAMSAIASNPTLRKVLIGATAAAGAIIAIRAAWRTAAAGARTLQSAATGSFRAVVSGAKSAAAAVRSTFSSITAAPGKLLGAMPGLPLAGMVTGIGGIAGALTLAMSSIGKAAEMETLETAFAPLIGGTENAKSRIKELADFAAATPFELPEVAQASRVLEVLTKGALATGDGLRMVGDVAAGTQQPFQEIAMWVGRLYDGLQSGRPVGEAMMRLQELGVVSGDVRSRIEALQKSGAAGPQIWNEAASALNRFAGAMKRQSETWTGKLSTLSDEIGRVMVEFGKPITDGLKPFLDMAIEKIKTMRDQAAAFGNVIKNALHGARAAWEMGKIAETLGAGIQVAMIRGINTFSAGISQTVAYLSAAVTSIMQSMKKSWGSQEMIGIMGDLANGLSSAITAGILAGIDKIPGIDVGEDATRETNTSKNSFNRAKNRLEELDMGTAFQEIVDSAKEAHQKGVAAARKALAEPLIDPSKSEANWKGILDALKVKISEYEAKTAQKIQAMDANLNNRAPTSPAAALEKVAKATAPAVTSLGRVGGGGFGSFTPMVAEQRRTNGLLRTIVKNTSGRLSLSMPVIA